MPTALDFDLAAGEFDAAADTTGALLSEIGGGVEPHVLNGGGLTLLTNATIDAADRTARSTADRLRELAGEARRRADQCRTYAADLRQHDRNVARWREDRAALPPGEPPPRRPTRPQSPGSWAEV